MMAEVKRYPTKKLECVSKAIELRNRFWKEKWQAKEEGKLLGLGLGSFTSALLAGFPGCELAELGNYFASLAQYPEMAIECIETVRSKGYLLDICHAAQLVWGSMWLDKGPFGPFLKPDFCFQLHFCETQGKASQVISEHFGIPYFCIDVPLIPYGEKEEFHLNYLVDQFQEFISWMERLSGRRCDDEKLIAAIENEWETTTLWARICELNKAVPAPLDSRNLETLSAPLILNRHRPETVAFYREVYEEVGDRVSRGIAALATERCRLLHEGVPPYYYLKFFRIVEKYGALFIGSCFYFGVGGAWERLPDGAWKAARTPRERGWQLRTREDALRALADYWLNHNPFICSFLVVPKVEELVKRVEDWRADGVVFHCDRGCQAVPSGILEARLALQKRGVPSVIYEASHGDPREFGIAEVMGALESFLESLGLRPLED